MVCALILPIYFSEFCVKDKILQSVTPGGGEKISVTNDGATILRGVLVDNPAARILIDISKSQDEEVGDGTTSVCVLAGELLREAERLIEKNIHPQTIISGFREATQVASKALQAASIDHKATPGMFLTVVCRCLLMPVCRSVAQGSDGYCTNHAELQDFDTGPRALRPYGC